MIRKPLEGGSSSNNN